MTSQIVLINQMGIGVASDTLMTSGGSGGKKTTPSSNKIYEVGPDHSVVVLHNGETKSMTTEKVETIGTYL